MSTPSPTNDRSPSPDGVDPAATSPPAAAAGSSHRLRRLALIGAAAVLAALVARTTLLAGGEDQVPWQTDYAAGFAAAEASGKPMLLYFGAEWCGACQYLERHIYSRESVAQRIERDFVPVKVDATAPNDAERALMHRYQAYELPTLVITDARGEPMARQVGAPRNATALIDWVESGVGAVQAAR